MIDLWIYNAVLHRTDKQTTTNVREWIATLFFIYIYAFYVSRTVTAAHVFKFFDKYSRIRNDSCCIVTFERHWTEINTYPHKKNSASSGIRSKVRWDGVFLRKKNYSLIQLHEFLHFFVSPALKAPGSLIPNNPEVFSLFVSTILQMIICICCWPINKIKSKNIFFWVFENINLLKLFSYADYKITFRYVYDCVHTLKMYWLWMNIYIYHLGE